MRLFWLTFFVVGCGAEPPSAGTSGAVLFLSPQGFQLVQPCITEVRSKGRLSCPLQFSKILVTLIQTHPFPGGVQVSSPVSGSRQVLYPLEEEALNGQPLLPGIWRYIQPRATDEAQEHAFLWDKEQLGSEIQLQTSWLQMDIRLELR